MKTKERKCPCYGETSKQMKMGFTRYGTQRYVCGHCKKTYTPDAKQHEYPEEIRRQAKKMYYSGVSANQVGKIFNMNKGNVLYWIKKQEKVWISQGTEYNVFELDEVYWYIKKKARSETRANTYIMTMISRKPRQIVAFAVDNGVKAGRIQKMADSVGYAKEYCTDGCSVYRDVIFGGKHKQNTENKSDTHNIESSNADLRHYIAGLRRRSRCFFRSKET